jgi:death-on-curing protein
VTWRWLSERLVRSVHLEQLAEHGGALGVRDDGLLASAIARPAQLAAYGQPPPDAAALAAAYAFGIVRNHPFVDGNKRVGFILAAAFLEMNGQGLRLEERDVVEKTLALAAGELDEACYAAWLRTAQVPSS